MAGRDRGGRVSAFAVRELRMRHGLTVEQAARLARVTAARWATGEDGSDPLLVVNFELCAWGTGDPLLVLRGRAGGS